MFSLCQFKLKKSVLTPEKLYFYMLRIIGGRSQFKFNDFKLSEKLGSLPFLRT
jgi:hypothetical protein